METCKSYELPVEFRLVKHSDKKIIQGTVHLDVPDGASIDEIRMNALTIIVMSAEPVDGDALVFAFRKEGK